MRAREGDCGFSLIEMLVASAITMVVAGAVFSLMVPEQSVFRVQPEISDLQQRLRVGVEALRGDLVMAGAGAYAGTTVGPLINSFAPVMPYRTGDIDNDPRSGVFYRADAISLVYVPQTPSQATVGAPMITGASELRLAAQPNCPGWPQDRLCGFGSIAPTRAIVFDASGAWDEIEITRAQDDALYLGYQGVLSAAYLPGAIIAQASTHTYYLKTDTFQLMQYDGYKTDVPVVEDVVKLEFEYYGDPQPPRLLPNRPLTEPTGPWTTYGPKPPALGVDNTTDTWGKGENCIITVTNGQQVPRLDVLAAGVAPVTLAPAILQDGPWCVDASQPNRFDADLLRIRRIRVKLRVEVAAASLRGQSGPLFVRGGASHGYARSVPDQEVTFDVTPRNMNLGR
jgi:hypothetical protein